MRVSENHEKEKSIVDERLPCSNVSVDYSCIDTNGECCGRSLFRTYGLFQVQDCDTRSWWSFELELDRCTVVHPVILRSELHAGAAWHGE